MRPKFPNLDSNGSIPRMLRVFLSLLAVLGALGVADAEAKKKPKASPPPKTVPEQIRDLMWELRGLHLDESGPNTSQIQKLVQDHLEKWIADRTPSSVEVRRELENLFALVRYPTYARPAVFAQPWKGSVLIGAGYTLEWPHYNRVNVFALFESREGKTRLVGVSPFVPYADLHYEFLPARGSDAFWFFIYGTRLGKSHPRLTAILYAYDGQWLNTSWKTHEVYDGKMDVDGDKVTIRYLKEDEFVREVAHGRKPPRHQAVYKITPAGLELETDREIPF